MTVSALTRNLLHSITVLALCMAAMLVHPVAAQEDDESTTIDVQTSAIGVPGLSHIPYVNKLFRNVGVAVGYSACDADGCQVAAAGNSQVVCQKECCQQQCSQQQCSQQVCTQQVGISEFTDCCAGGSEAGFEGITKFELISTLTEALAQVASLEAALEAHAEFAHQKEELFSSLANVMIENAKLQARAEHLNSQLELQAQIAQTMVENAKLQAKLEFVAQREQHTQAYAQTVAENQKLKVQVAKLEKKHKSRYEVKKGAVQAKTANKAAKQLIER